MNGGRSSYVPLVTVTEGIDTTQNRHRTINPVHFEGCGIDNHSFFEGISSFLCEKYEIEKVDRIYLHADGGNWIKAAKDYIPNVSFVMDDYHLQQRLKQISHLPNAAAHMSSIRKALREDDCKMFLSICKSISEIQSEEDKKKFFDQVKFFRSNWDSIVLRMSETVCGSCTEGMVSHVLSKRLSRNPLSWSENGIRKMAMLRVYTMNDCVVKAGDIRVSRKKEELNDDRKALILGFEKYRAYTDKQIAEVMKDGFDPGVFASAPFSYGKLDGTSILLKAFSRSPNVFGAS